MDPPAIRYARSGNVNIAYATVGDGPIDIVFISGWVLSNLEGTWDGPPARLFERLASIGRLILFDKRGTGLSDRVTGIPDLETRMDDVRAVMGAAGSRRAAIVGVSEGGPMTILFAATYPERIAAAVMYGTAATWTRAEDYPWRPSREERLENIRQAVFARFDGPARAIRCACAIASGLQGLGLQVRLDLHTGECELIDGKVGGIAVHIGARVAERAASGEVLVSSTVHDLVAGSGIRFEERGMAELKGIPGQWRLYSVDPSSTSR